MVGAQSWFWNVFDQAIEEEEAEEEVDRRLQEKRLIHKIFRNYRDVAEMDHEWNYDSWSEDEWVERNITKAKHI